MMTSHDCTAVFNFVSLACTIIILMITPCIQAQVIIHGSVTDSTGAAIPLINILAYPAGGGAIIAFAVSDDKGDYKMVVKSTFDSLDIEATSIHYQTLRYRIANSSQQRNFVLRPDLKQLDMFTVKAQHIRQQGDTISYLVSRFMQTQDRSIEDVLRRMPGIEIESSGRILYEGVPIEKFYVEGLDLMDGRYGVVSKNLPKGSVSTVEILENHQPMQILQDRVSSFQPSLNLNLQHDVTATGTAQLGIGASPLLWEANVTPMVFTKNFQMIASYQTNNTGNDAALQLEALSVQDMMRGLDRKTGRMELAGLQSVAPPDIAPQRYLDNQIHLGTFNSLQRLARNLELRVNVAYVNDFQQQKAASHRTLFYPSDTLQFSESVSNKLYKDYLQASFALQRNVKNNYLQNILAVKSNWDHQTGIVDNQTGLVNEKLRNPFVAISNDLRTIVPAGKKLIDVQSYISLDRSPQELQINPGVFSEVFNQDKPYEQINQFAEISRFYTHQSAAVVVGSKKLSFTPRIGFSYRDQLLESAVIITENGEERNAGDAFVNEIKSSELHIYAETGIEYKIRSLTLSLLMPLSWQDVHIDDKNSEKEQLVSKLFFNPKLTADYDFNNFWSIRGSLQSAARFDDPASNTYGFILRDYRYLSVHDVPLDDKQRLSAAGHLSYRNPISAFFNKVSYVFTSAQSNYVYSNQINPDGSANVQAIEIPQTNYIHSVQLYSSKYLAALKATVNLRVSLSQHLGKSLVNEDLFDTKTNIWQIKPEVNFKIARWLNFIYNLDATTYTTFVDQEQKSSVSMLKHKLNVFTFPRQNQLVSITSEYYHLNDAHNVFVDILYRYTFTKKKIDVEFRWTNLLNNDTYTSYQAWDFTVWESTYRLRPSQAVVSVKFSF
jgi:hypothetical protein